MNNICEGEMVEIDMVDKSSEYCSSSDEENYIGNAKLFIELRKKNVDAKKLESLLKKLKCIDVRDANDKNSTPLHVAVRKGHVAIVNLLLKYGARVDLKNDEGQTPLLLAKTLPEHKSISKNEILDILNPNKELNLQKNETELRCDEFDGDLQVTLKAKELKSGQVSNESTTESHSTFLENLNKFNEEGKTSLGVAVEKKSLESIKDLIGLSLEDSSNFTHRKKEIDLLDKICDGDGNTPLILCAKIRDIEKLDFFLSLGVEINKKNRYDERAVDYSWRNKDYFSVLTLLKKDSYVPSECTVANIEGEDENAKSLKQFLFERDELHKQIKLGNLDKIKELIRNDTSELYLSPKNESARFVAGINKHWNVYAYLFSRSAKFLSTEEEKTFELPLTQKDIEDLKRELEKYILELKDNYIIKLVGKSKWTGDIRNVKKVIEGFYVELDRCPNISAVLRVLQYSSKLEIILDFNSVHTKNMHPTDESGTKGKTDYENSIITIAAKDSNVAKEIRAEVLGTLAHEMTHQANMLLYGNKCNPYTEEDNNKAAKFNEITENILKAICLNIATKEITDTLQHLPKIDDHFLRTAQSRVKGALKIIKGIVERGDVMEKIPSEIDLKFIRRVVEGKITAQIDDVVKRVYTVYQPEHWHAELIVRIPHMLAKFGNEHGKKLIDEQVPELVKFYEEQVIQDCKDFLLNSSSMKHAITILDMNEYLGEIQSIQSGKIRLEEPSKNKLHQCYYKEKFWLVKASSIHLCSIYFYQTLLDEYKSRFQQCCLFIKLSYFEKNRNKVLNALKSKACEVMVLISDVVYSCDVDRLSEIFTTVNGKVIVIINESHNIDCLVTHYSWNSLKTSSKEHLMEKIIHFQGKQMPFNKLFDNKTEIESLDGAALRILVEENKIEMVKEKELISQEYDDDYYISRYFRKQTIKHDVFTEESCPFILYISNATEKKLRSLGAPENYLQKWVNAESINRGKRIIYNKAKCEEMDGEIFRQICQNLASKHKSVHWLNLEQNFLLWKKSNGDTGKLIDYVDRDKKITYKNESEFIIAQESRNVIILADNPGMGKSTMLSKLAKILKEMDFWVVKINVIDYVSQLKKDDSCINEAEKAVGFVASMLNFKDSLEKWTFTQCCKHSKKIVIMFDGFDEIPKKCKRNLVFLLKALAQTSIAQLWISTRLNDKTYLEKELKVFAYSLNHWTKEEKVKFLNKFWKKKLKNFLERNNEDALKNICNKLSELKEGNKELMDSVSIKDNELSSSLEKCILKIECCVKLHECDQMKFESLCKDIDNLDFSQYAATFLDILNEATHDEEGKLTFIPLHTVMLANLLLLRNFRLEKKFNFNDLYDYFVHAKFDIYFDKNNLENECIKRVWKHAVYEAHQVEAMKVYLSDEKSISKDYFLKKIKHSINELVQIGLITPYHSGFKFIHRTYVEFFFSKWLIENSDRPDVQKLLLEKILIDRNFSAVRQFLNSRIEKERKRLCGKMLCDLTEREFFKDELLIKPLLSFALEGLDSLLMLFFEKFTKSVCSIIGKPGKGENIFHYACKDGNKKVINSIFAFLSNMEKKSVKIMLLQEDHSGRMPLQNAFYKDDVEAVELVISHAKKICGEEWVQKFMLLYYGDFCSALHVAALQGSVNVLNYLWNMIKSAKRSENFKDFVSLHNKTMDTILHIAALKGYHWLIKDLLNVLRVQQDILKEVLLKRNGFGYTVLHLAVLKDNVDFLEQLKNFHDSKELEKDLLKDFLLTIDDAWGDTALHKAAFRSKTKIFVRLLEFAKDVLDEESLKDFILKPNSKGYTALHKGISFCTSEFFIQMCQRTSAVLDYQSFMKLLTKHSKYENTVLHTASARGELSIVKELFEQINGKIPLKFIMETDLDGDTIFHKASIKGNIDIFFFLVEFCKEKLCEICFPEFLFKTNKHGNTFLQLACKSHTKAWDTLFDFTRKVLSATLKDFLMKTNCNGYTLIHYAVLFGTSPVVIHVFERCKKILGVKSFDELMKTVSSNEGTLLHAVASRGDLGIAKKLCAYLNDTMPTEFILQTDIDGNTIFHKASTKGNIKVFKYLVDFVKTKLDQKDFTELMSKPNKQEKNFLQLVATLDDKKITQNMKEIAESLNIDLL